MALVVSPILVGVIGFYLVTAVAYSMWLKRYLLVDVFLLISFYCTRVLAGALASAVQISPWLVQFMLFCFLSLATAKRTAELLALKPQGQINERRGYKSEDLDILMMIGTGSGLLSALVVALYVNSPDVQLLYHRPYMLWLLCPVLLYWFTRLWVLTRRGQLKDDPVIFAFYDRITWGVAAVALLVFLVAL